MSSIADLVKQADCCGCGSCCTICPTGCISFNPDIYGFLHPTVDANSCIDCGLCLCSCPALSHGKMDEVRGVYWAKAKSREDLIRSSSGGVFSLLAHEVFREDGIVYGAAFASDLHQVYHIRATKEDNLFALTRSKYIQSAISSSIFKKVEKDLKNGHKLLFCGTPCQIKSLNLFLNCCDTDVSNLLTVDVVCHGVPSPLLWGLWIDYLEKIYKSKIKSVNFRCKETGWKNFSIKYDFLNGTSCQKLFSKDWYMRAFLCNVSLRESCFNCPSKSSSGSDLTLGDFWGIEEHHSNVAIADGVSAVIVHTKKGEEYFKKISNSVECGRATWNEVLDGNPCVVSSVSQPADYVSFMEALSGATSIKPIKRRWGFGLSVFSRILRKLGSLFQ